MVSQILNQLADAGGEVMDLLAFPLPVWVIGELLGVPVEDREQFRWIVRNAAQASWNRWRAQTRSPPWRPRATR